MWRAALDGSDNAPLRRSYVLGAFYEVKLSVDLVNRKTKSFNRRLNENWLPAEDWHSAEKELSWQAAQQPFSAQDVKRVQLRLGINSGQSADAVSIDNVLFDIN